MRKIISALVLGATVAGFAVADISISANYRMGLDAFAYNSDTEKKSLFNLTGYNSGANDGVTLKANGDIFTFTAGLAPGSSPNGELLQLKILTIGANAGNFSFLTGWNRDGIMTIKSAGDTGDDEGKVYEAYKIGGGFGGDAAVSNNQAAFGKDQTNFFAQAGYGIELSENAKLNIKVAALSPNNFEKSNEGKKNGRYNVGWNVFVNPVVKKVFEAEVFVKGHGDKNGNADPQTLIMGAYGKPTGISLIKDAAVGGSVYLKSGELEEWNVDLRFKLALNDKLSLTSLNKFASTETAKALGTQIGLGSAKPGNAEQMLWDLLSVRYTLNATVALTGTVGQQTVLKGDKVTQLFIHPHAQIFAGKGVAVTAGVVCTLDSINKKDADTNVLINVPVLIRVKL